MNFYSNQPDSVIICTKTIFPELVEWFVILEDVEIKLCRMS